MHFHLAVEDIETNHWVAWVVDVPGCYSPAKNEADAIAQAPDKIRAYFKWLRGHDPALPIPGGETETSLVETFHSFTSSQDPDYLVNAFFEFDRRPLDYWEVANIQRLLDWQRQDLEGLLQPINLETLHRPIPDEVQGSLAGILNHIASAENWYFSHLGLAFPWADLPDDVLEKLSLVRQNSNKQIWTLIGDPRIVEKKDEKWSARKVLRRTMWHERDHFLQIRKLLGSRHW